jgi:hypothetical protein
VKHGPADAAVCAKAKESVQPMSTSSPLQLSARMRPASGTMGESGRIPGTRYYYPDRLGPAGCRLQLFGTECCHLAPNLVAQVAKTFVSKLSHGFQMVLRRSGSADIDQQIDDAPTPCPEMRHACVSGAGVNHEDVRPRKQLVGHAIDQKGSRREFCVSGIVSGLPCCRLWSRSTSAPGRRPPRH